MVEQEHLICSSDALRDGECGVRFEVGGLPAFVVRFGGTARAYFNRCGHVPTELDWKAGEFFDSSRLYLICAVHGALYDPSSGDCLGGRCNGKGLQAVRIAEQNGSVFWIEEGRQIG